MEQKLTKSYISVKYLLIFLLTIILSYNNLSANIEDDIWDNLEKNIDTQDQNAIAQDLDSLMDIIDKNYEIDSNLNINNKTEEKKEEQDPNVAQFLNELSVPKKLEETIIDYHKIHIRVLNKITGFFDNLYLETNKKFTYNELELVAHKCFLARKDKYFNYGDRLLLELIETNSNNLKVRQFSGWTFSKNRALSDIKNAKYEILFIGCNN